MVPAFRHAAVCSVPMFHMRLVRRVVEVVVWSGQTRHRQPDWAGLAWVQCGPVPRPGRPGLRLGKAEAIANSARPTCARQGRCLLGRLLVPSRTSLHSDHISCLLPYDLYARYSRTSFRVAAAAAIVVLSSHPPVPANPCLPRALSSSSLTAAYHEPLKPPRRASADYAGCREPRQSPAYLAAP